jgi:thiol-disulfide isomerase/thioredoxin
MATIRMRIIVLLLLLGAAVGARAEGEPFQLSGITLAGRPYSTDAQRGKVLMLFYWSTDCAVCRSKMAELRANAQGWRGKPFELVLVSEDRRRTDLSAYDNAWKATQDPALHPPSLWAGEAGFADSLKRRPNRLPLTIVLDAQGVERARFEGRIPADAWDAVADLLP